MKNKIFKILDWLNIDYKNYEYIPVFTCDDCRDIDVPWFRVKSLLIRNKNGSNFYMVMLEDKKRVDTNKIREIFNESKMSFVNEDLMMQKIWLKPWSVSPFALINNIEKDIKVIFDEDLKGNLVWFHPLQNDNTISLNMECIEKFLEDLGFEFYYVSM